MGAQGAVFKLSEDKCVKIYSDPVQAKMEKEALASWTTFTLYAYEYMKQDQTI